MDRKERDIFEAWAELNGHNVKTDGGDYYCATTSQLYAAWRSGYGFGRAQGFIKGFRAGSGETEQ